MYIMYIILYGSTIFGKVLMTVAISHGAGISAHITC